MNIAETGDMYVSSNIPAMGTSPRSVNGGDAGADTTEVRPAPRVDVYTPEQSDATDGGGQDSRDQQGIRDEYIPGPAVMRNALYNVSDVKTDASGRVVSAPEPVSVRLGSAGTSDKIADIMLSMGRKLLSIFRITA